MVQQITKERDVQIDNVKAMLIILVVMGHSIEGVIDKSGLFNHIYYILYSFHMPVFIFITGYLSVGTLKSGRKCLKKVIYYINIYIIVQIMYTILIWMGGGEHKLIIQFAYAKYGLWYVMCLPAWLIITYLIKKIGGVRVNILPIFIVGITIGCIEIIGHEYSLSRMLVFLPYFVLGSAFNNLKYSKYLKKGPRSIGSIILIIHIIICILVNNQVLLGLYRANLSFVALEISMIVGMHMRMIWYIYTFIVILAFITVIPREKTRLTYLGNRTFQVYLMHGVIISILISSGTVMNIYKSFHEVGVIIMGIVIILFTSLKIKG